MESHVLWNSWDAAGMEHLHVQENADGVVADGVILNSADASPFRLWYKVRADRDWHIKDCELQLLGETSHQLHLCTDGLGHWTDGAGVAYPALDGCTEVDFSRSPFTNTLPIRRLMLVPGQSADIQVVYISVPDLSIQPLKQRYTCLEQTAAGGLYRYEGLDSGFTVDLPVDAQGIVLDYPGYWKRIQDPANPPTQFYDPLDGLFAPGPDPEFANQLQLFGQFVGAWDCRWTGYSPDGSSQTGKGEIHFAWVLEGRAIQDLWIFPSREERRRSGLPVDEYGTTLRFYDSNIDSWRVIWTGPVGRNARVMTAHPEGENIVVAGTTPQGRPLRWIFSDITDQSFHWTNFISDDDGQSWRVQEELVAQRVTSSLLKEAHALIS